MLGDFDNIVFRLLLGETRIVCHPLRFDNGDHLSVGSIEAIVRDAVPRLGILAVDGDLKLDLRPVREVPARAR